MEIGIVLRNAGPAAHRDNFIDCAQAAEHAGFDTLWLFDHIAIAPDQAEGSDGIYYDALATLSFLAGCTERIGLRTGVLILPYRPALLTAKWLATLQSVSNNRLQLGVGVGWMASATAVPNRHPCSARWWAGTADMSADAPSTAVQ